MRWRFSLKCMLLAVLAIAVVARVGKDVRDDRQARDRLQALGVVLVASEDYHLTRRFREYSDPAAKSVLCVSADRESLDTWPADVERIARHAERLNGTYGIKITDYPDSLNLSELRGFRSLRLLELGKIRVTHWQALLQFPDLNEIVARSNPSLNRQALETISSHSRIHRIHLPGCIVTDSDVEVLLHGLDPTLLVLRDAWITEKCFAMFGREHNLHTLDVSRTICFAGHHSSEHHTSPSTHGGHSSLFRRYRYVASVTPDPVILQVPEVRFPSSLRWLDCSGWDFTADAAEPIKCLRELEYLNLSGQSLSKREAEALASLSDLRHLGLADTDMEEGAAMHLAGIKNLQVLDLRGTRISSDSLIATCRKPNLEVLLISGPDVNNPISESTLRRILPLLSGKTLCIDNRYRPIFISDPQVKKLLSLKASAFGQVTPPSYLKVNVLTHESSVEDQKGKRKE